MNSDHPTLEETARRLQARNWQVRPWQGDLLDRLYVTSHYRGECGYFQFGPGERRTVHLSAYENIIRAAAGWQN